MRYLLAAGLFAGTGIGLSASLHFPEVLLDDPAIGASLVDRHPMAAALSLLALFATGAVIVMLARASAPPRLDAAPGLEAAARLGIAAGATTSAGAALGLLLLPGWSALATLTFIVAAILAPLLLAAWTLALIRAAPGTRVIGTAGAVGLVLTAGRSVVWLANAHLSGVDGFYVTSTVLTVLSLAGGPLWICWLARMATPGRKVVAVAAGLLVPVHAYTMLVSTPTPVTAAVPAVPSAAGALRYGVLLAFADQFALPTSDADGAAQLTDATFTRPEVPAGTTREAVDAGGVPAEWICATGATRDRVALYIPGGGFVMPPSNSARTFAGTLSRQTGACVLMPAYRLGPEHPYPAARLDTVAAYRWLRQQGLPGRRIAVLGDSAGGNLTLTTALALKQAGDELPAALVSISAITDFTMSGATFRTKDAAEGTIVKATQRYTVRSYAAGADPHDPLLSPLYADVAGLPPTLLMVGSQEVLLDDVTRMAHRMTAAGVPARLEVWPGMPHSWQSARKPTMETNLAVQHISAFIARAFR